ncbi:MAG: DUF4139 domain-containing protein [Treponema sp.]|jgi:hypothetical protein|nr:DUF4139 domain-containing protein [Treponema sp.]
MTHNKKKYFFGLLMACWCAAGISAQAIRDNAAGASALPVTKIAIFSSGLAYYEHTGTLGGPSVINLPFKADAVNDALKSLVLNDPASANPSVSYQSEQTLFQTLASLRIDLSLSSDMASILSELRGAEIEIAAPGPVSGRIVGIEYRSQMTAFGGVAEEYWLSLYTDQGIKMFNLKDIAALNFKDPQIGEDLKRALDLIELSRNSRSRDLAVNLPGSGSRTVSLSYVIPAPVWKVSYRLDLGREKAGGKPLFQGWAIVDNDSDSDWNKVELSLVAGRPVSFIQNLYPPYYLSRPVLPLAIAGTAAAATHAATKTHDAGVTGVEGQGYIALDFAGTTSSASRSRSPEAPAPSSAQMMKAREAFNAVMDEYDEAPKAGMDGGVIETAAGAAAGDQFEFTVKNPVSLDRRMSAMLPLVESPVEARRLLFFSGATAGKGNQHPRLSAELTNTSGMKLPAGPITVYDGGTYAGDALIEFWNEGEKRLISFGEDLSVNAAVFDSNSRTVISVKISGGVMTINRSQEYMKTYTFHNTAAQAKSVMVEHPATPGASLETPQADEQTPTAYRFTMILPAEKEITLLVRESRPIMEKISLLQMRQEIFLSYVMSNQEIPPAVQAALRQAVNLWNVVNAAETAVTEAENRRSFLVNEQERVRKNIEVTGGQTQQGQEYLKRLQSLDNDIDKIAGELEKLKADVKQAQKAYTDYLGSLNL